MKLRSSSIKAMLVGVSGTALQWYDFALFGYFAPIIAATYFPNDNPVAAILRDCKKITRTVSSI